MKMTSAYANKMLKQLSEDKEYWINKEDNSCIYTALINEQPVVPEYDYSEVAETIDEIDRKILLIKHAVNAANVNTLVKVGDKEMSVDCILVRMAQLNKRKVKLDYMRKQLPKGRKKVDLYNRNAQPEYQYINYDLELIKQEFERVNCEIMDMQMALDIHNQTFEFDVEI